MAVRRLAPDAVQPASFAFSKDNLAWAKTIIAKYPEGRHASAVIPLLWRAQEQHQYWLPRAAMEAFYPGVRDDAVPIEWCRKDHQGLRRTYW